MSGLTALDFFEQVDNLYGFEDEGLLSDGSAVTIPVSSFSLTEEHQQELERSINPMAESLNYGIDIYEQTLAHLHCTISHGLCVSH